MDQTNAPQINEPFFIVGTIRAIIFEDSENHFKLISVNIQKNNFNWDSDNIVVLGTFGEMEKGTDYRFEGKLINHPKYGKEFKVNKYEMQTINTNRGLIAYLSSDEFPGIGEKTAERVVESLGTNLIKDIIHDPKVLNSVDLTQEQRDSIVEGVQNNNGFEQIIIELSNYGFGTRLCTKIYDEYGESTLSVIRKNPYQLVEDIKGISFYKADQLAKKVGVDDSNGGRIRAGIMNVLDELLISQGCTYTDVQTVVVNSMSLLNDSRNGSVNVDDVSAQMMELANDNKIVGENGRIYLKSIYDAEWQIAENLKRIMDNDDSKTKDENYINKMIKEIEFDNQINYDQSQVNALKKAMQSQVFLLTGGPGTGKTTIIKGLITLYAKIHDLSLSIRDYSSNYPFVLAAPTGRAARRMRETTGVEASTIHKLLGLNIDDDNEDKDFDGYNIHGDILIVDEMSMVDTYLFRRLICAIPNNMKVILVGDKDQLPSVGPGQIFSDLLESGVIPSLELNTIYRQNNDSTIIDLAHNIKNGQLPSNFKDKQSDRSFISCNSQQAESAISFVVSKAHERGFTATDIQVLAPMYRGMIGVDNLNTVIQEILNPKTSADQKEVKYKDFKYRIGDKVLQLVNSSENNVFNGDIGKIVGIDINKNSSKDNLVIAFDDVEVTYQRKNWDQISLAYCTTIHKAQGSEFKMVILPAFPQYGRMLKRNLLYTAVTRAANLLIMVGDFESFVRCVHDNPIRRRTSLVERIRMTMNGNNKTQPQPKNSDQSGSKAKILTDDLIKSNSIDPMIGMDGITPYK